jgi:hypothetical protein
MTRLVTVVTPLHEMASADLVQTLGELEALKAQVLGHLAPPRTAPAVPVERISEWRLTAREVMDRLKVSRSWLYKNSPRLSWASRIGSRNWRYSEKGLAEYMRKRAVA